MNNEQVMENEALISAKDVSVILSNNLILSQVSISLKKSEMAYIIGKTGSGKSTLLKTVYGEVKPTEGAMEVLGYDMLKLKRSQVSLLRRKMGMVFQDFQLLTDRSVIENLLFVMKATGWKKKVEMHQKCDELLQIVRLSDKANSKPHQLSGGEQQRVCIARALINNPQIILADEPTGNLDPDTAKDVMNILVNMHKQGISVLMVTHNYNLIEMFPAKTYQCVDGKVDVILEESDIQ
jgi:cell division transport system ATP-binding protein